jgi:spoIIIJ-associated protein
MNNPAATDPGATDPGATDAAADDRPDRGTDDGDTAAAPDDSPAEDGVATNGSDSGATEGSTPTGTSLAALLEQEGEIAADYLEGLLDIADLDGDLDMDVEGERAIVSIVGASLTQLVGAKGEALEALQEVTRLAVHRRTGVRSRLMLDIGGWRVARRAELTELGRQTADKVRETGEPVRLEPMTPFERKAVHDAVTDVAGVVSESDGEEPRRCIVIRPDSS